MSQEALPINTHQEIASRRTFAIISHPDAGKTTLTEKLLLYSGMVRTAGMVRGRKNAKAASSDWMAMEQERGISITASAMQFPYKGAIFNVLDTPGHQDFSEDTYRTLTAADSAIMVIDASKGVEAQTRKLFAVCRMRGIPILTFINKMDLPSRDPLELMQEVEEVLGIRAAAINWPIGYAKGFAGVVEIENQRATLFQRSEMGGSKKASAHSYTLPELKKENILEPELLTKLEEDLQLLSEAGTPFDKGEFLRGQLTPMFFGSALSNFGLEPFLDRFIELAPSPRPCPATNESGETIDIDPERPEFSAFVFKIQSNMNPKHRDSMAFLRVCSGVFEREMVVKHHRLDKEIRLARSYSMVARDRSTVDYAFPGDVIGAINPGTFAIGDTISVDGGFNFKPMPKFPPEVMGQIRPLDVLRRKSFEKGMTQLSHEGAIQVLKSFEYPESPPFIAAVGKLQFDVLQFRLKEEYNVDTQLDMLPYKYGAYVVGDPKTLKKTQSSYLATDVEGRVLLLYPNEWEKRFIEERSPDHKLVEFVQG